MFEGIENLDDLIEKGIRIGLGETWPDARIVESSGLRIETFDEYQEGFSALHREEFDCFSRGVNEIFKELETRDNTFTYDEKIYLKYEAPIYFFVSPENDELANRIQRGLESTRTSGDFDCIFLHYFAKDIAQAKLPDRDGIVLDHRAIPKQSPHQHTDDFEEEFPSEEEINLITGSQQCEQLVAALKNNRDDTSSIKLPLPLED